jgi:Bacterial SH3 domain
VHPGHVHIHSRRSQLTGFAAIVATPLVFAVAACAGDGSPQGDDGVGSPTIVATVGDGQQPASTSGPAPGPGGSSSSMTTATGSSSPSVPATSAPTSTAATTTTISTATSTPTAGTVAPVVPQPDWELFDDVFFVHGVPDDDELNVRAGPGVSNEIITTLAPGATGVRVYDVSASVGRALWRPVQVSGGAGWVNARFLRPVGTQPPRQVGTVIADVAAGARDVVTALQSSDFAALAALAHPTRGVTFSPYAFVGEDDPVITRERLATAGTDDTLVLWGHTDGEGAPIESTIAQRIVEIAGSTALTSTDVIGHDVKVGSGNSLDNLTSAFPGDRVVEYHFSGTSRYGDYDWTSVRLVFDTSGPDPLLVAVVQDTWTI